MSSGPSHPRELCAESCAGVLQSAAHAGTTNPRALGMGAQKRSMRMLSNACGPLSSTSPRVQLAAVSPGSQLTFSSAGPKSLVLLM